MPTRIRRPWIWRDRPQGVIDVTRSTRFGNPFIDGDRTTLVARYRQWVTDPDAQPSAGSAAPSAHPRARMNLGPPALVS